MKTLFQSELDVKNTIFNTWDDAARSTVQSIFSFSEQCGNKPMSEIVSDAKFYLYENKYTIPFEYFTDHLAYLKSIINFYIEMDMQKIDPSKIDKESYIDDYNDSVQIHQAMFLLASHCSITMFNILLNDPKYSGFVNTMMNPSLIASTVIKKQNDYGPENVAKFGMWGLIVRLHDKIARFENLMSKSRLGRNSVSDETIYDTLLDIVGYSTVAILWSNGWFLLPLEKDLK